VLRDFWAEFNTAIGGTKELRTTEVLNALDELLGPHFFADKRRRQGRPRLPALRQWPAVAQTRPHRPVHRLRQLSRMPLYPCARRGRARRRGRGGRGDARWRAPPWHDPVTGLDVTARDGRFGPYVQLGEGEKPKRSSLPKGTRWPLSRWNRR
jgi:DNA topoisomerase-1